jgi:hypothetical protein
LKKFVLSINQNPAMSATQFPVRFLFRQRPVTAFVTVRPVGYDLSFRIRYQDDFIKNYLPGGTAVLTLTNGVEKPLQLDEEAEQLILATTEAITEHIHFAA